MKQGCGLERFYLDPLYRSNVTISCVSSETELENNQNPTGSGLCRSGHALLKAVGQGSMIYGFMNGIEGMDCCQCLCPQ